MLRLHQKTSKHSNGYHLLSGGVPVGDIDWDGVNGTRNGTPWKWVLNLPGKSRGGACSTVEEANAFADLAFQDWLRVARLKVV